MHNLKGLETSLNCEEDFGKDSGNYQM